MIKHIGLLKRHPNLSHEDFRRHYEEVHAKIGEKYLKGRVERYLRRYLTPLVDPTYGVAEEQPYDIVMELWFADEAAYRDTMAHITTPEASAEIIADEEYLFDRSANRFFTVTEMESEFA